MKSSDTMNCWPKAARRYAFPACRSRCFATVAEAACALLLYGCADATGATPAGGSTYDDVPSERAPFNRVSDQPQSNEPANDEVEPEDGGQNADAADAGSDGGDDAGSEPDGGTPPALTQFDDSFGADGRVLVPAPDGFRKFVPPRGCLIGANGAVTISGSLADDAGTRQGVLVRVGDDGALEPTFGAGGIVTENFGMPFGVEAAALAETASGGLRVFGHAIDDEHGFFVAQRTGSGAADESFGTNGLWRTALDSETMRDGASVLLRLPGATDEVLVGGWNGDGSSRAAAAWKFTSSPNFGLAPGFGVGGSRSSLTPPGAHRATVRAGVVQSSGAIVLSGEYQTDASPLFHAFVVRLLPAGQLDTTFGSAGWALADDGAESSAEALALLGDDRLVVAGYRRGALSLEPTLWRLSTDGTMDATFGSSGRLTIPFGQDSGRINDIQIDGNGRLLVAATLSSKARDRLGIARLSVSGALDPTFFSDGFYIDDAAVSAFASHIVVDVQGRVIVTGALSSGELLLWRLRELHPSPNASELLPSY